MLEPELLNRRPYSDYALEAGWPVVDFIEGGYNPNHCHAPLGLLSPVAFEKRTSAVEHTSLPYRTPAERNLPRLLRFGRRLTKKETSVLLFTERRSHRPSKYSPAHEIGTGPDHPIRPHGKYKPR
jgi:hypothetical protein